MGEPRCNPSLAELDKLFEELITLQRTKVLDTARKKVPHLTAEDVMTPEAYPSIYEDGPFNYEDGILNGLLTAQMAVRARFAQGRQS